MAIEKIPYADHDQWLAIRHRYIGGSDAGAIMGMNPYCSAYTLWAEKTGRIEGFKGNTITEVGAYLEEFVAQMFERETGKKVRKCNFTLVNSDFPWACANLDRVVTGEDAILEIKTTNSFVNVKKFRNGDYPESWYCQMTHYLAVTGKKKAYLAVLSECKDFRVFEMERDDSEISALMDAERVFWNHVCKDTPVEIDGSESTADTLQAIEPKDDGTTGTLAGLEGLMMLRASLKKNVKTIEDSIGECENKIKAAMGTMSKAVCGTWNVSYAAQERTTFDWKKFEQEHPGNYGMYKKVSSSRVLRITEKR